MKKNKILVISRDKTLIDFLCALNSEYEVVNTYHEDICRLAEIIIVDEPEIVILDVIMPTLDGIGICVKLRVRFPEIPIMILTTWGASGGIKGLNLGNEDCLTETFDIDSLKKRLEKVINDKLYFTILPPNTRNKN